MCERTISVLSQRSMYHGQTRQSLNPPIKRGKSTSICSSPNYQAASSVTSTTSTCFGDPKRRVDWTGCNAPLYRYPPTAPICFVQVSTVPIWETTMHPILWTSTRTNLIHLKRQLQQLERGRIQ